MPVHTKWRGGDVEKKINRSVPDAIDAVTEAAAAQARGSHWWRSRTGHLQAEIINEPARRSGVSGWTGRFGATRTGFYGLFLEYKRPFLRPAADATFRTLAHTLKTKVSWSR